MVIIGILVSLILVAAMEGARRGEERGTQSLLAKLDTAMTDRIEALLDQARARPTAAHLAISTASNGQRVGDPTDCSMGRQRSTGDRAVRHDPRGPNPRRLHEPPATGPGGTSPTTIIRSTSPPSPTPSFGGNGGTKRPYSTPASAQRPPPIPSRASSPILSPAFMSQVVLPQQRVAAKNLGYLPTGYEKVSMIASQATPPMDWSTSLARGSTRRTWTL